MDFIGFGGAWFLFAVLMQFAVLALVVLGIIWLVRHLSSPRPASGTGVARTAVDELELRYARGEIDRATYQQMLEDLTKSPRG